MTIKDRKEREKEQRRTAIVNAASKVLKDFGYDAFSMDKVAEYAELSKGALYLYFESKENLLIEMAQTAHMQFLEKVTSIISQSGEFENILTKGIEETIRYFQQNLALFRLLYFSFPFKGLDFMKNFEKMTLSIHGKESALVANFFEKHGAEKFRIPVRQAYLVLHGLIASFFTQKLLFDIDEEINPKTIAEIFLRGVLK